MKIEYKSQPLKQDWNQEFPKYWFDGSPLKTHFMNAMSIIIPISEYTVIHTIKETQKLLKDPELKQQVSHMIAQENWHSYSHKKYNEWLESIDLPAVELSSRFLVRVQNTKKRVDSIWGDAAWLPGVVSGEHNIAVLIEYFLERPELFEQMHPHFRQSWVWHFIEELEHKGTSMDMWIDTQAVYNRKKWKLNLAHVIQGFRLNLTILHYMFILLNRDGQLWRWQTLRDGMSFFFGRDGLFFKTMGPWCKLFGKKFHPWDHDTRYLIAQYQKIIDTSDITLERQRQIEQEFQGCVADIEAVIAENNNIHVI